MFKLWLNMWKNIFNFTEKATRKEFWIAAILNNVFIFIFVFPYGLILRNFDFISPIAAFVVMMVAFHLPLPALFFRRANDVGWKKITSVFLAIFLPAISAFLVGILPTGYSQRLTRDRIIVFKVMAIGFSFCNISMLMKFLNIDNTVVQYLPIIGILISAGALMVWGYINRVSIFALITKKERKTDSLPSDSEQN